MAIVIMINLVGILIAHNINNGAFSFNLLLAIMRRSLNSSAEPVCVRRSPGKAGDELWAHSPHVLTITRRGLATISAKTTWVNVHHMRS